MLPFTLLELTTQIKKLFPDKSSGPSGITNRMLQAGNAEFQSLFLLLFNGICQSHVQPTDWQLSLMQPIYKGHDNDQTDLASYRGIYLNDTLPKLFEGLLLLTTHTELDLRHTLCSTTLSPLTNLVPNLAHTHMTLSTLPFPPSNTTSIHFRNLHMWSLLTTPLRRESSKRNYYIISPRVIIKAIIITAYPSVHRDHQDPIACAQVKVPPF